MAMLRTGGASGSGSIVNRRVCDVMLPQRAPSTLACCAGGLVQYGLITVTVYSPPRPFAPPIWAESGPTRPPLKPAAGPVDSRYAPSCTTSVAPNAAGAPDDVRISASTASGTGAS